MRVVVTGGTGFVDAPSCAGSWPRATACES